MAERRRLPPEGLDALGFSGPPADSLLDVVDSLLDKGVALDGELVLGLADIDLIYIRLGALVAAADRVFPSEPPRRRGARGPADAGETGGPPLGRTSATARQNPSRRGSAPPRSPGVAAVGLPERQQPTAPADLSDANRSVMRLVLTLVEFIRSLLERQAIRRVEAGSLTPDETERLGSALMLLDDTVRDLAVRHGIDPSTLNLDLGPIGRLK